jgi:hypothetical protein
MYSSKLHTSFSAVAVLPQFWSEAIRLCRPTFSNDSSKLTYLKILPVLNNSTEQRSSQGEFLHLPGWQPPVGSQAVRIRLPRTDLGFGLSLKAESCIHAAL